MEKLFLCTFVVLFSVSMVFASATVQNFSINKSVFHEGDSIIVSGQVNYDPATPFIILQVITPDGAGLAHIANILPKNDGSFSKTIHAGGPTWYDYGTYTIKISYDGNMEKTIVYEQLTSAEAGTSTSTQKESTSTQKESIPAEQPELSDVPPIIDSDQYIENPKMRILGYPSFDKSPQYYIDRYYNEPEYQSWFDSQFPNESIFDVLGFSTYVPEWIKTYAQNWAKGDITDSEFMTGLDFMLKNKIIVIQNLDFSKNNSVGDVPPWFRNTAHWWSNDLISQQEFINAIKYLIQEDIILVE